MSKMSREDKLFRNEMNVLNHYREMVTRENSPNDTKEALENLTNKYKSLLEQTRFLTWISGRLERKLQRTNRELSEKNFRLVTTLKELTKAEAGKNAYAIIYFIAIMLFVLEEFFVEPVINMFGEGLGFSILIKLMIVLLLKVSEGIIEKRVIKKGAFRQALKEVI
jgi:chromosome segregation ATPase